MTLMKVSIVQVDAAMQPIQCHDLFSALAMVCGLLRDASQNKMVGPVDRESVSKSIGLLIERLATVHSLTLGEE